jgi:hypothetical protein
MTKNVRGRTRRDFPTVSASATTTGQIGGEVVTTDLHADVTGMVSITQTVWARSLLCLS